MSMFIDSKALPELVNDIIKSNKILGKLFADDGAYDDNNIFRYLSDNGCALYQSKKGYSNSTENRIYFKKPLNYSPEKQFAKVG